MAKNYFHRRDFLRTGAGMLLAGAAGGAKTVTNGASSGTSLPGSAGQDDVAVRNIGETTTRGARIGLDGKWKLFYFPQGKYPATHPDQLKNLGVTPIEATVPGNAQLDLSQHGELPADLYYAENIKKLRPYENYEWWYQREFATPKGIAGHQIELCFHGVDCMATYWLNGQEIGTSQDALVEHRFDVTGKLRAAGSNILTVRLKSPVIEAANHHYDPAYTVSVGGINQAAIWMRKAPHCYGWDIMPRAVSVGIWRPVELIVHAKHEITSLYFTTLSISPDRARLMASYELKTDFALLPDLQLKLEGRCGDSSFTCVHKVEFTAGQCKFEVSHPALWWPKGYGKPDLYQVTTQLLQKGKVLAEREDFVGIRTVQLLRTDTNSVEKPGQFLFKINDVPIMCKGSNWVPADAFHSRDAGRYQKILEMFIDLGCNILRSWGGSVYEDNGFFDICDRNGIMVWQDFAMACAIYPQAPEFLDMMRREAVSVVRKLRNHPSIVLWSGDNECDWSYHGAGLDPGHNKITRQILPAVSSECDPYRPYLPSSPYYSPEVVASGKLSLMPESHLWGPRDYFKSTYYTQHTAIFVSEIGYDGCPGLSSIKRFVDKQHVWPYQDNPQWVLHSTSMAGNPYRIELMSHQLEEYFGAVPDNIEDYILASQFTQAEALKFFIEMTRLGKWRRTGLIWWNVMDGWPQFSDAIVDYYFNKKLAYYYIRRVQVPVCVMVDEPKDWQVKVVVGNDSRENSRGHYRIWNADSGETVLDGNYSVRANENLQVGSIPVFSSDKRLFLIEWTANGKRYVNHYLLGSPPFALERYKSWLTKIAALQNDFKPDDVGK